MLSNQRAFGMDRTLTDGEWLELSDCILAINRSTTNESVRFQVLKYVLDIVPFHTAAFFVANANRIDYGGAVIVQPIGTESLMGDFERQIAAMKANERDCDASRASADGLTWVVGDFGQSILCEYRDDDGLLGALIMNRLGDQQSFTKRDVFVLKALEPHINHRLKHLLETDGVQMLQADMLVEEYHLTPRELEVVSCAAFGMTQGEIAVKLSISPKTAKKHIENIYRKVGVNNRLSLMRFAQQYMTADKSA